MQVFNFHRSQLNRFDRQHLNLAYNQDTYLPYINRTYSLSNFERQIDEKEQNYSFDRSVLVEALKSQYTNVTDKAGAEMMIESLREANTFTVTTGHQLSVMTGPLYFVIKILQVIKLSGELKKAYPEYNFVPVYWMASEDHDFEEIQTFKAFGKELTFHSDQKGAVGHFSVEGLEEVKETFKAFFANNPEAKIHSLIESYSGENLSDATRNLVHELFKEYGLVIIDGDDVNLKKGFKTVFEKELTEQFSYKVVTKVSEQLKRDGGKMQIMPREINLFYLSKGARTRIIQEGGIYKIEGTGDFSKEEILEELEKHPERFSPNVVLRPLYQEYILPNLSYTGGVGEISYWLQLSGVFEEVGVTYPLINVRNSVMWIDKGTSKKMAKIDLVLEDVFKSTDSVKREFVEHHSSDLLDFKELDKMAGELTGHIEQSILAIDASKQQFANGEITRLNKQLDAIKAKMVKFSKSRHDEAMKIIETTKSKLFPNDGLQERSTNFFAFAPDGAYEERLRTLYNSLDPWGNDFIVIREV